MSRRQTLADPCDSTGYKVDKIMDGQTYCVFLELLTCCCFSAEIQLLKMSEDFEEKIKAYKTAPFDARFPNTNQTRNCYQNYLGK